MRTSAHFWNSSKSVTNVLVLTTSAHAAPAALRHRSRSGTSAQLGAHVALADAIAVDIPGKLAGRVDDLAGAAHRHTRIGRLSVGNPDIIPSG
jgi:hypothetical protein